ncbi:pimeloyl-ACP methyl ester carboxylesterase [Paraburkholderia sp. HC6.4b]|uniref:alpha/beta fold hydrolase n=1 Tax=unclassified Paraburkholderia TaxID=2615204 RepID=UPI00160DE8D2|nr:MULTISPECIES: alpha/beta hydrolase [unclassified Paraburkholderia]MBB5406324.1 pimeloyl-ACP methyl ester carboxylesterase [Paraburkholderia sp. HC6.4b]MBB5448722.1 pimeloyl-ACP methyl ester carboxylesterase [Paraburkholderia sp. Kb1A]
MLYTCAHTPEGIGYEMLNALSPWRKAPLPVLFQHGLGANRSAWAPWWGRILGSRSVVGIDLRGHGSSGDADIEAFTVERIGADIIDVLDRLDIERVHYVGESFGGTMGLYLAAMHPDRIATVTACSTPYKGAWINNASHWKPILDSGNMEEWSRQITAGRFLDTYSDTEFLAWLHAAQVTVRPQTVWRIVEVLLQADLEPVLGRIKCPVLNIMGNSPFVDPRNPQNLSSHVPQVENIKIPGTRHGIIMSHWKECSSASFDFMDRWENTMAAG